MLLLKTPAFFVYFVCLPFAHVYQEFHLLKFSCLLRKQVHSYGNAPGQDLVFHFTILSTSAHERTSAFDAIKRYSFIFIYCVCLFSTIQTITSCPSYTYIKIVPQMSRLASLRSYGEKKKHEKKHCPKIKSNINNL